MKHSATECRVGTRSLRPLRKTALTRARSEAVRRLPSAAAAARRPAAPARPGALAGRARGVGRLW